MDRFRRGARLFLLTFILYLSSEAPILAYHDGDMTINSKYGFYRSNGTHRKFMTIFDFSDIFKGIPVTDDRGSVIYVYIPDPTYHPDVIDELKKIFSTTTGRMEEIVCSGDNPNIRRFSSEYDMISYNMRKRESAVFLIKKNNREIADLIEIPVKRMYP